MNATTALILPWFVAAAMIASPAWAQTDTEEEPDFVFFSLIDENGQVPADVVAEHCANSPRALSVETRDLVHTTPHQRVWFSGRQITNVNANPGEWTGALYKPLCPGLYSFSVDYMTSAEDGATDGEVVVHLHTWHRGGRGRPGELSALAVKAPGQERGVGHASVIVEMATGDEFSLFTLSPGAEKRRFERLQLTAFRVDHIADLAQPFDTKVWDQERADSDAVPGAMP
ncbi:MAG: hypothetical protein HOH20_02150 [Rhodospirillaceae bacterium]|jgi:hypothetical protein|nr:hypothetical protein [Rhodospirillaceae bacterium]MBT5565586.1 hypothetical protein [Rhodospirillaceae bacterium]MBT6088355.1 hypothetical protein [Rhodospirillaceae bacterium]MBT6962213.1 hypothetical protein [Rhodospirillaceae bacterium]